MSTLPENEFDLEKLFLPAWAQEPSSTKSYANYQGEERFDRSEGRRGPRPPRREGGPPQRRSEGRPGGERRGPRPGAPGGDRGNRPGGEGRPGPRGPRGDRGDRGDRNRPREHREPPAPLPEINLSLVPDEKGVEFLARQIKMTGRAYPLFDIAQMILQKPERHAVAFSIKKNAEGQTIQPLFLCALDDTLWLSEDEAVAHVLKKHFATFYQAERTATEPPKGKYTFVAQCGISGVILGPPNLHDYQNQLRKLHAERFSRMPFDAFKSRVRIVRDEEVVKKWVEDQSWKTDYLCLNMPESARLESMEAVEKHFRENHKDNIIKPTESHALSGGVARNLRSPDLVRLVRSVWEDQRRFPLQIATVLSQQFATHGLQFFKVNKTITHVSVARPHYLDLDANPVSEGVKRIVVHINANPKCTRRQLVEALAPTPTPPPGPAIIPVPPPAPAAVEPATEPLVTPEGAPAPVPAPAPAPAPAAPAEPAPTAEQTAVIADLHWLIHQGHVIEFANGTLETAKKPLPKPPKPEKPAPVTPETPTAPAAAAGEAAAPSVAAEQPATEEPPAASTEPETPADSGAEVGTESAQIGSTAPISSDGGPFVTPEAAPAPLAPAEPAPPAPTTDPAQNPPSDPKI